jgi:hypothetical protein
MVTQYSNTLVKINSSLGVSRYGGMSQPSGLEVTSIVSPTMCGGHLYFVSNGGGANKLYRITSTGIFQKTPDPSGSSANNDVSNQVKMVCFNGMLYFRGQNSTARSKLYRQDPATGSTVLISNTSNSTSQNDNPSDLTVVGSSLYFMSNNSSATPRRKLYRLSGTTISAVSNISASTINDSISMLTAYGSDLYFAGTTGQGLHLYKTNGTTITPITTPGGTIVEGMTVFNSFLYFFNQESDGNYLYKYNGTNLVKLSKVSNITNADFNNLTDSLSSAVIFNNEMYFIAENRLHKINTADQITKISSHDLSTVNSDSAIISPVEYNSELYFIVNGNLYKINSKGQLFLIDNLIVTSAPIGNLSSSHLAIFDGYLYYNKVINSKYKIFRIKVMP